MIPFAHNWSHFFQHINTFEDLGARATPVMPPDELEKLSKTEVALLRDWIQEGAKNRLDEYYWAENETKTTGKLFSLCAGSDLVAVSDLTTNRLMRFVEVGNTPGSIEAPHYIILSPDRQYFYITLIEGGAFEKYRADNYELVDRVEIGASPALIHLNPSGTRAIISHWNDLNNSPKITMVNTEDMSIVEAISASGDFLSFPHGIKTNADFSTLYICANNGNYYMTLEIDENGFDNPETYPIDPVNSPITFATDIYKPYQVYLSPDESKLFITCSATNEVRVFDTQNNQLLAAIPVGGFPRLMDFDANSNRLFVACRSEENFPQQGSIQGCLSVIDTENLTLEKNIYNVGHRPHGVSVDTKRNRVFVSSENSGGVDVLHHPLDGTSGPPGKYNVVDIQTLTVLRDEETEIAVFPNALVVSQD